MFARRVSLPDDKILHASENVQSRSEENQNPRSSSRPGISVDGIRALAFTNACTFVKHSRYERPRQDPIRSRRGFLKAKLHSNLISPR